MKTLKECLILLLFFTTKSYSEEIKADDNQIMETDDIFIESDKKDNLGKTYEITTEETGTPTEVSSVRFDSNGSNFPEFTVSSTSTSTEINASETTKEFVELVHFAQNGTEAGPIKNPTKETVEIAEPSTATKLPMIINDRNMDTIQPVSEQYLISSTIYDTENVESSSENKEPSTTESNVENSSELLSTTQPLNRIENSILTTEISFINGIPRELSLPECTSIGNFSIKGNCHTYYTCDGGPIEFDQKVVQCAQNSAFNVQIGQCSRDISSCGEIPKCLAPGTFADPESTKSYYMCIVGRINELQKYHIQCNRNEVFSPLLGLCFSDLTILPPDLDENQISDLDIVKHHIKLIDEAQKIMLKLKEDNIKLEAKQKKKQLKLAAKEKKRLLKLADQNSSGTIANPNGFVCPSEGSFEIPGEVSWYYSCVLKRVIMSCPLGQRFKAENGKCMVVPHTLN